MLDVSAGSAKREGTYVVGVTRVRSVWNTKESYWHVGCHAVRMRWGIWHVMVMVVVVTMREVWTEQEKWGTVRRGVTVVFRWN